MNETTQVREFTPGDAITVEVLGEIKAEMGLPGTEDR